jgi:hypothetical protein
MEAVLIIIVKAIAGAIFDEIRKHFSKPDFTVVSVAPSPITAEAVDRVYNPDLDKYRRMFGKD